MKKKAIILFVVLIGLILAATGAFAATDASIVYLETNLGGGWWKYDYTLTNLSTSDEYLYKLKLTFDNYYSVTNPALATGWTGAWGGTSIPTNFLETHSSNTTYDIASGNSLDSFSFTIYKSNDPDTGLGDLSYKAYFADHAGGVTSFTGNTALESPPPVVPEPLSAILFLVGGLMLGTRAYVRRKKVRIFS